MRKIIQVAIVIILFAQISFGQKSKNLVPSPPMGWNSWNWFGKNSFNEQTIREVIDAMVNEGLRDAGYKYVVIDGGWRDTKLGPNGELLAHPEKFPHGIKPLAEYAHSKGLKLGLHTVPGTHDCGGDPVGGFGHEKVQIQQFIDWGVDFVKLDKCKFLNSNSDPSVKPDYNGWDEETLKDTYFRWSNLLKESGSDIILSISAYVWRDWYPEAGNMARTTGDIKARVGKPGGKAVFDLHKLSVMGISEENDKWSKFAGNRYWNDPDMMVTGDQGLSEDEQRIHFALWSIMSSPLFLGNDPRNMTQVEKDIVLNRDAISINQDPTEQGKRLIVKGESEIWAKKLKNGNVAVLLLNRNKTDKNKITLNFNEIGIPDKVKIKDIYAQKELGSFSESISKKLKPHAGIFLLIDVQK